MKMSSKVATVAIILFVASLSMPVDGVTGSGAFLLSLLYLMEFVTKHQVSSVADLAWLVNAWLFLGWVFTFVGKRLPAVACAGISLVSGLKFLVDGPRFQPVCETAHCSSGFGAGLFVWLISIALSLVAACLVKRARGAQDDAARSPLPGGPEFKA